MTAHKRKTQIRRLEQRPRARVNMAACVQLAFCWFDLVLHFPLHV